MRGVARVRGGAMSSARSARRWASPLRCAELFAFTNLAFLGLGAYVARPAAPFADPIAWGPMVFSIAAPGWLALTWLLDRRGLEGTARIAGYALGACGIAVGIAGVLLQLKSHVFTGAPLETRFYAAPLAAPLAYTGLGLLVLLDRLVHPSDPAWSRWLLFLAFGGFTGTFALSLADHAENGFFDPREWIAVAAAAFATAFLAMLVLRPSDGLLRRTTSGVMGAEIAVGALGFALHLVADSRRAHGIWETGAIHAPLFAPLLFVDLALLALVGGWALARANRESRAAGVAHSAS